jgi:hypothetical protein
MSRKSVPRFGRDSHRLTVERLGYAGFPPELDARTRVDTECVPAVQRPKRRTIPPKSTRLAQQ